MHLLSSSRTLAFQGQASSGKASHCHDPGFQQGPSAVQQPLYRVVASAILDALITESRTYIDMFRR